MTINSIPCELEERVCPDPRTTTTTSTSIPCENPAGVIREGCSSIEESENAPSWSETSSVTMMPSTQTPQQVSELPNTGDPITAIMLAVGTLTIGLGYCCIRLIGGKSHG